MKIRPSTLKRYKEALNALYDVTSKGQVLKRASDVTDHYGVSDNVLDTAKKLGIITSDYTWANMNSRVTDKLVYTVYINMPENRPRLMEDINNNIRTFEKSLGTDVGFKDIIFYSGIYGLIVKYTEYLIKAKGVRFDEQWR